MPQSNGFVERLHRTLLEVHFQIKGRSKWQENLEEMQKDLEVYLKQTTNYALIKDIG